MSECYCQHHQIPPSTRIDNTRSIDSAWCSTSLRIVQTSFFACGDRVGKDHQIGWLEVLCKSAFGVEIPMIINLAFVSVKYQDTGCRKKRGKKTKK